MDNSHLGERVSDNKGDSRAQNIANDDARPGKPNGDGAPQKQANTNGAANGKHAEMSLAQPAT
jgi:hypothetical protein